MKFKAVESYYVDGRNYAAGEELEIQNPGADIDCMVALGKLERLHDDGPKELPAQQPKPNPVIAEASGRSEGGDPRRSPLMTTENTGGIVPPPRQY